MPENRAEDFAAAQAGCIATRNRLVADNYPLACDMANKVAARLEIPAEELAQEGAVSLMRSVMRFDPARGFAFSTYACNAMMKSMLRYAYETAAIRVPQGVRAARIGRMKFYRQRVRATAGMILHNARGEAEPLVNFAPDRAVSDRVRLLENAPDFERLLLRLHPKQREVIVLRFREALGCAEAGRRMVPPITGSRVQQIEELAFLALEKVCRRAGLEPRLFDPDLDEGLEKARNHESKARGVQTLRGAAISSANRRRQKSGQKL